MSFQISIILSIILCIIICLWLKERKLRIVNEKEKNKKDILLTEYIAKCMDMEKALVDIKGQYVLQQDMAEELKKIQSQCRLLKHDMKNHSMVILSYLEENNIKEARNYTSKILDNLNKMYTYINVGNSLLNYIINRKLSQAKKEGIKIKAEIENLAFAYMDSIDFSSVLNNLLDNAVEAASSSKEKQLEVILSKQKGFDSIVVKNSIDNSVLDNNPKFNTTKEDEGHGFGMYQIQKITEKYNGMMDIYEDNGFFVVNVVYPY